MKVNKVYAEEIAKMEGGDAARPFTVQWDVSESGADLKVVYRTPRIALVCYHNYHSVQQCTSRQR